MNEPSDNIKKWSNDIRIAGLLALIYGGIGIITSIILPFLSNSDMQVLAPHVTSFDYSDIAWNLLTDGLSVWWGVRLLRNFPSRLTRIANLLGLYILKTGAACIGFLVMPIPSMTRLIFLLPAVFLITLAMMAQIKIQKKNGEPVREKFRLRLSIWIIITACLLLLAIGLSFIETTDGGLLEALESRDIAKVMTSVKDGEDPNQKIGGRPLIFLGIPEGDSFAVEALTQAGADINAKSDWGRTALHEAALRGQVEITKFLLEHGADVNARNNRGETPLFYAEGGLIAGPRPTEKHRKVAEILKKNGGVQ